MNFRTSSTPKPTLDSVQPELSISQSRLDAISSPYPDYYHSFNKWNLRLTFDPLPPAELLSRLLELEQEVPAQESLREAALTGQAWQGAHGRLLRLRGQQDAIRTRLTALWGRERWTSAVARPPTAAERYLMSLQCPESDPFQDA